MSAADSYTHVTGETQAVIAHTDVGIQALSCAVHNASVGRYPVFIFLGMFPATEDGALPGSRTEYMHWIQEPMDQKPIVGQYCRYTAEGKAGNTIRQMVGRAMQFATSALQGPVYLCAPREVMEQEVKDRHRLDDGRWEPIRPSVLPHDAVEEITEALTHAESPLVITAFSGRNHASPPELVKLADNVRRLRVLDTGGSDMCSPTEHGVFVGVRFGVDGCILEAEVILVLDCPVPWIHLRSPPRKDTKIFHIDPDHLNATMPAFFFPASGRWKADSALAVRGVSRHKCSQNLVEARSARLTVSEKLAEPTIDGSVTARQPSATLKKILPPSTTFVIEAVTNAAPLAEQLRQFRPGSWLNCGGTGIGWSGGAAIGVKLTLDALPPF